MLSPAAPAVGPARAESPISAPAPAGGNGEPMSVGAVSGEEPASERAMSVDGSDPARCLLREEVKGYLLKRCPAELRARVDAHIAGCTACARRVRHLDDEILEYMGGQRPEEELARMDAHLDACRACRDLMHHVVQGMAQTWQGEDRGPADSTTTFTPGSVVNSRYRIRSFVGRGGMGEVYEAFDQLMDRRVALKTVLCNVADRPRASRRFKEEVRNAQRVAHAHVCRINELQEHRDVFGPPLPFFTMEFIDGERLGYRIQLGTLALADVKSIAHQLLAGLEAAHERGVLHLDFKSDNVMLRRNTLTPDAVIMDFGLSRVLGKESRLRTSERRQFAGTLSYMSVEQLECRDDVGPATDVYSFGVVLYEMLTRKLPFAGDSLSAALLKQLKERPKPPSFHLRSLAPALDRFVLRCLSPDPGARFADAGQALAALRAIGPWTRRRRSAQAVKALPLLGVVALGLAASSFFGERTPPPTSDVAALAPALEQRRQELAPAAEAQALESAAAIKAAAAKTTAAETAAASESAAPAKAAAAAAAPLKQSPARRGAADEREVSAARPALSEKAPALDEKELADQAQPAPSAEPSGALRAPTAARGKEGPPRAVAGGGAAASAAGAPSSSETTDEPGWKPSRVPRRLRSESNTPSGTAP